MRCVAVVLEVAVVDAVRCVVRERCRVVIVVAVACPVDPSKAGGGSPDVTGDTAGGVEAAAPPPPPPRGRGPPSTILPSLSRYRKTFVVVVDDAVGVGVPPPLGPSAGDDVGTTTTFPLVSSDAGCPLAAVLLALAVSTKYGSVSFRLSGVASARTTAVEDEDGGTTKRGPPPPPPPAVAFVAVEEE